VTATRGEIAARVDALAQVHEGDEFVAAVARLAEEVGAENQALLHEVLLERAAEEEEYQAVRARAAARGWTRRTLDKLDGLSRNRRADEIAWSIEAGADGEAALAREVEIMRGDRGKAAVVLDALSRNRNADVRAWVPPTAVAVLEDGAQRLVLSMTRDRDRDVRIAAVAALVRLGPEAARPVVPDLRRRLHSDDAPERIAAMGALAELGDDSALLVIEERSEAAELEEERRAAQAAARILGAGSGR
jgi:hypothetical protein